MSLFFELGLITNNGKKTWQNVHIEAEFYDGNGHFIDEGRELIWSEIILIANSNFAKKSASLRL